jgi:VWFA-related protein
VRDSNLEESVSVGYVVLDARALDSSGRPMTDLTAEDFRVRVDGREVRVTSAEWVAAAIPTIDEGQAAAVPGLDLSAWPRGRLIVLFFQRDLIPSRMTGLMRMRARIADFVAELPAEDLVAILVHDTRLWLHTDFTGDRELLAEVLNRSIIEHRPPPELEPSDGPSLLKAFDYDAAEQASSAEAALLVLARALQPVPGSKAIVFMGWGLGRYDADPATVSRSLRSLLDARAALFALDVTDADYHTLEGPLFDVAMETGGLYLKTNVLSGVAMRRMAGAIEGHYELSFPKPDLPTGQHRLSIDLREARGTVYHRDSYVD